MQKFVSLAVVVGLLAAWGIVPDAQAEWVCQARLIDTNEVNDTSDPLFGGSPPTAGAGVDVDIYGDYAILGVQFGDGNVADTGAACIYKRTGKTWTHQARLFDPNGQGILADPWRYPDNYGWHVAIGKDRAAVSAYNKYHGAPNYYNKGAGFIYSRSGATWQQETNLYGNPNVSNGEQLGMQVKLSEDGDVLVLGTGGWVSPNPATPDELRVYHRSGGTWSSNATLAEASVAHLYGSGLPATKLSRDGTRIVASDPYDPNGSTDGVGPTYVYRLSGGSWVDDGTLPGWGAVLPYGPFYNKFSKFACDLNGDIEGDYIAIGERLGHAYAAGGDQIGRVYIWKRVGDGNWQTNQVLIVGNADDEFGYKVGLSDGVLAVLAKTTKKVYFFENLGGTWTETDNFELTDEKGDSLAGVPESFSYQGNSFIVGVPGENGGLGAAYVYANQQAIGTVVMVM